MNLTFEVGRLFLPHCNNKMLMRQQKYIYQYLSMYMKYLNCCQYRVSYELLYNPRGQLPPALSVTEALITNIQNLKYKISIIMFFTQGLQSISKYDYGTEKLRLSLVYIYNIEHNMYFLYNFDVQKTLAENTIVTKKGTTVNCYVQSYLVDLIIITIIINNKFIILLIDCFTD